MASCGNSCANGCKYTCTGCSSGCGSTCQGTCKNSCRDGASINPDPRYSRTDSRGNIDTRSCNNTCWAMCGGSCSGNNDSKIGTDGRNADGNGCSCGKDCAGCGGCSKGCSGCTGDCSGCSGSCGGSCSGTCSKGCSYTCSGDCKGYCKGTCNDGCLGKCTTACTGECKHLCNATCVSNVAEDAYNHLSKYKNKSSESKSYDEHLIEDGIVLDWLDAEDIRHLFGMIQEEGRRRILMKTGKYDKENSEHPKTEAQTLTRADEELIGIRDKDGILIDVENKKTFVSDFVDDEKHIKKLINMLVDNTGRTISLASGSSTIAEEQKIKKSIAETLLDILIKDKETGCYFEPVPVNTTSESTGRASIEEN